MSLFLTQSQNTILRVSKEHRDFIEHDTDIESDAKKYNIEVEFFKDDKSHVIVFHDLKNYNCQSYEPCHLNDMIMHESEMYTSNPEEFLEKVKKLLKNTTIDYAVYDYETCPDFDKLHEKLEKVSFRFFII